MYPQRLQKYVGEKARFICSSRSIKEWLFNDLILPQNAEVFGLYKHILILHKVKLSNSGIYRCITIDEGNKKHIVEGELSVKGKKCLN